MATATDRPGPPSPPSLPGLVSPPPPSGPSLASSQQLPARWGALQRRLVAAGPAERGDVPGWVLVTLMSALLVVTLLGVARGELVSVFQNAIDSVSNP